MGVKRKGQTWVILRHVMYEMPIRHLSGDVQSAVKYTSLEFRGLSGAGITKQEVYSHQMFKAMR